MHDSQDPNKNVSTGFKKTSNYEIKKKMQRLQSLQKLNLKNKYMDRNIYVLIYKDLHLDLRLLTIASVA